VNHFHKGKEWLEPNDLAKVLPVVAFDALPGFLSDPKYLQFTLMFELPDGLGNLHVQLIPATLLEGKEVYQLSLTAFGKPLGSDVINIVEWIERGHNAVVQAFADFTSKVVQTKDWGKIWP
jgi:hypothetical protein